MNSTKWEDYGVASGNPKCANCMVSCGYEPSAVLEGFGSLKGFFAMVKGSFSLYPTSTRSTCSTSPCRTARRRW
jgi:hypothetical protein